MKSKHDYGTPRAFIDAVNSKWGPLVADLAAHAGNAKCETYLTESEDSLVIDWAARWPTGNLWLNPPFANIEPWARKCREESVRRDGLICMLTPASIGTDWFAEHVHSHARVLGVSPRLTFDGTAPNRKTGKIDGYPKDLMISLFGRATAGFDVWKWR
jgi:phage N-6-adenine-methyltransferase